MLKITFVNTSRSHQGKAVNSPVTNSHIAARTHALRRLATSHRYGRACENNLDQTQNIRVRLSYRTSRPKHEAEVPKSFSNPVHVDHERESQTLPFSSQHLVSTDRRRPVSPKATSLIRTDPSYSHMMTISEHPADCQLSTSLDPFIRMPVEISSRERSLLYFQLDEGRRLTLGTLKNAVYCPAIYLATSIMQTSPIYIYSTIAQADLLVQTLTGTSPTKTLHLRQAQAYKALQVLLNDDSASFEHRLAGFSQLFLLALYLGRQDLQELHLLAMYEWIMHQGGFSRWMPKQLTCEQTKHLEFYAAHFAEVNLPIKTLRQLHSILSRFTSSLRAINSWARFVQNDFKHCKTQKHHLSASVNRQFEAPLAELAKYLDWLLEFGIGLSDDGCCRSGGGFYLLFNLCNTQAQYQHRYTEALSFIQHTASVISGSADTKTLEDGRKLWKPVPASMAIIMGYVRAKMPRRVRERPADVAEEVTIAESSIDARLILPYLSDAMKLKLAKILAFCACTSIVNPSLLADGDVLDDVYIDHVAQHVTKVWKLNQEVSRGFDGNGTTAYSLPV